VGTQYDNDHIEEKQSSLKHWQRSWSVRMSGFGYNRTLSPYQNNFRFPVIRGHFCHQFHFSIFDVRFVGAERKSFEVAEKGRS